ncbi:MAG: HlyD family efflux transporter periplasmic adaptor subunit [Marinobacter sp.]|nr:HlyD family efflux transporter periplasmic adaptor subunit [Marinobacter sp.]
MSVDVRGIIEDLRSLRLNAGAVDERFWSSFVGRLRVLCLAETAAIYAQTETLQCVVSDPRDWQPEAADAPWLTGLIQRAVNNQFAVSPPGPGSQDMVRVAIRLMGEPAHYLLLWVKAELMPRLNDIILRAELVADIPVRPPSAPSDRAPGLLTLLELVPEIYQAKRFSTAAYGLVNSLVSHSEEVDQVVLGWRQDHYIRAQAISHFDRFEKKTELVKLLEAAMEEAADQAVSIYHDERVSTPAGQIRLAHQQLRVQTGCNTVFTLPLGDADSTQGQAVLMLISHHGGFSDELKEAVHFIAQLLYPRLCQLKEKQDGWLLRGWRNGKRLLAWSFGPEHLWTKILSLIVTLLLLYGIFGTLPHRVEGSAKITTESIRVISAPFDGQVDQALGMAGDPVSAHEVLAIMDVQDLLLQRAEAQADLQRYLSEVNRARAALNLIEQEIAAARVAQTEARLSRLAVLLEQARLRSPFDGVVVEGERQQLLGLPVSKGQQLYRVARIEGMYLQVEIRQEDIHHIVTGDRGEFVFLSQPDRKLPFTVTGIIPMAQVRDASGAMFQLRAELDQPAEDWWRPGMSGVAKVDKGRRQVLWVIGHRLMNRLRLWLWW